MPNQRIIRVRCGLGREDQVRVRFITQSYSSRGELCRFMVSLRLGVRHGHGTEARQFGSLYSVGQAQYAKLPLFISSTFTVVWASVVFFSFWGFDHTAF
jgi:hypothetical protein